MDYLWDYICNKLPLLVFTQNHEKYVTTSSWHRTHWVWKLKYIFNQRITLKYLWWFFRLLCEPEFVKNSELFEELLRLKLVDIELFLLVNPLLVDWKASLVSVEWTFYININHIFFITKWNLKFIPKLRVFWFPNYQKIRTIDVVLKKSLLLLSRHVCDFSG